MPQSFLIWQLERGASHAFLLRRAFGSNRLPSWEVLQRSKLSCEVEENSILVSSILDHLNLEILSLFRI